MLLQRTLLSILPLASSVLAASSDSDSKKEPVPCTIRSASTGNFFNLEKLHIKPEEKDDKESRDSKETAKRPESFHVRGYDFGANFTLNVCGPVVEELEDVVGVTSGLRKNVSAYYTKGSNTYSIGSLNTELVLRGRKLVLNYTNGSPCGSSSSSSAAAASLPSLNEALAKKSSNPSTKAETRRKSTIISFLCDREPLPNPSIDGVKPPSATISFVGTSDDECAYFFEAKSIHACPTIDDLTPQQLGPGGVFAVIVLIALLVYFVGGCVYQRTVMHQRGWKQLPNYALWAGLFGFVTDIVIILTASCAKCIPGMNAFGRGGRGGYSRVSTSGMNGGMGGRHSDDSNRLIDQLDEEWDD